MLSQIVLCLLVGFAAAASDYAWKSNTIYEYNVAGRTLTSWDDVADQYSGILIRAKFSVQPRSEGVLFGKLHNAKYARLHANMPDGWDSEVPEDQLTFQPLPLQQGAVEITLRNGTIQQISAEQNTPTWEVNIYKSVLSQFQVDVQGENMIESRFNQEPDVNTSEGNYMTMEDDVVGKCETHYDIAQLPTVTIQTKPWIAPEFGQQQSNDENLIQVVKTRNFTRCVERVGYHYGLGDMEDEPGSSNMGDFFTQSSVSHVVITGTLKRHTIQSSVTVNKVVMSPTQNSNEKGTVVSRMNLTLTHIKAADQQPEQLSSPKLLGNLVYSYNEAFGSHNYAREGRLNGDHKYTELDSSSSSSSSSSSEEELRIVSYRNAPRKERTRRSINDSGKNKGDSSSSSSSSSESNELEHQYGTNSLQQKPRQASPPSIPFRPYTIGYKGRAISESKEIDISVEITKLSKKVAEELDQPSEMPKKDTLDTYSVIVRLVRLANHQELQQISSSLYGYKHSEVSYERNAWIVYRDAVAQSGTSPALSIVREWIQSDKIEGQEAGDLISVLASNVRYPTGEYMQTFFGIVKKVENHESLNETAALSFSQLVRQAYVYEEESHNQYPVHTFGKLTGPQNKIVETEYIPYFAKQLKKAVEDADSQAILLYIRALGNLGHKNVLVAFKPYLEGEIHTTHFQRLAMVAAMDKLAKSVPKVVRSVLYKIYANQGEKSEIRALAVHQLMRTMPTADMLQRMAQNTNDDTDDQVNAAIKTAIQSAAQLRDPRYRDLADNAKSAEKLLTTETYGIQYSSQWLVDFVNTEMDLIYKQSVRTLGSEDSFWSKGFQYSIRTSMRGYEHQHINAQAMVSSVRNVMQLIVEQTETESDRKSPKNDSQFSAQNIARQLNIQVDDDEEVEGFFDFGNAYYNHFYSFTNASIRQMPEYIKEYTKNLTQGQEFNYTKLYNMYEMTIGLPTVTGLPLIYTFENPIAVTMNGKMHAKVQPEIVNSEMKLRKPDTLNVTSESTTMLSYKTQVRFGFVTPFDHQHYVAGYDKKIQLNLPIHQRIDVDLINNQVRAEFKPIHEDRSEEIFHYSTWAYTAQHDILELKPLSKISNVELINVEEPKNLEFVLGRKNGMAFRLNVTTHNKYMDYRWMYEMYQKRESLPLILAPLLEDHLVNTNISLSYDSELSHARAVVITFGWNSTHEQGNDEREQPKFDQTFEKISNMDDTNERQEYLLKKAGVGINSVDTSVFDLSIQFDGSKYGTEYNLTLARGWSPVDQQTRHLVYYSRDSNDQSPFEACVYSNSRFPNLNAFDFLYALNFNSSSEEQLKIAYGESCQTGSKVEIESQLYKSESRKQWLREDPMAHDCEDEMKQGNKQLNACQNMTIRANQMDRVDIDIKYENVGPQVRNATYKMYNLARYLGYYNLDEDIFASNNLKDEIKIRARIEPTFESLNVTIESDRMTSEFRNIRVNDYMKALLEITPEFTALERIQGELYDYDYKPVCVIDQNTAKTFDNTTYEFEMLPETWYVGLVYVYNASGRLDDNENQLQAGEYANDYSILIAQAPLNKKKVKIVVSAESQDYEIDLLSSTGPRDQSQSGKLLAYAKVNGNIVNVVEGHTHDVEDTLIQIHALPGGAVIVHIDNELHVSFDGERVKILSDSDNLRGDIRGLCGNFDGRQSTDFLTPKNCYVQTSYEFTANYIVADGTNAKATEVKQSAERAVCIHEKHNFVKIINEQQIIRHGNQQSYKQNQHQHSGTGSCSKLQTQYFEEQNGEVLCFSVRPLPACNSHCKATKKIVKNVDVHCVQKSNVSALWKSQIQKGASPDFSLKPATKTIKVKVDQGCQQ